MKVLMIFPRVPFPVKDGGAIAMYNLIQGVAVHQEVDLHLFFINTSKHRQEEKVIRTEFEPYGKVDFVNIDNEITVKGAVKNIFSSESYFISRFIKEAVASALKKTLKNNVFDVVHIDGLQAAHYVELIRMYSPETIKVVLRQHNVEHLIWERVIDEANRVKKMYLKFQTKRLKKFELEVIHRFDSILPISGVDEKFFKDQGVTTSYVLPVPISALEHHEVEENEFNPHSFYHLGSMDWQPNQEGLKWFLDEVWPVIHQEHKHLVFHVAGRNMPDSFFAYDGLNGVQVHGEVEDAIAFAHKYGTQIVPLNSGSGLRVKILEAFGLGKLVLSTSVGCEGIDVEHQKNILIADTTLEFLESIQWMLSHQEKVEIIAKNALDFVHTNFSRKNITDNLVMHYQELIAGVLVAD